LVLADTLLEVFEPELQLVRAQLLRPTAELMTAQLLDQQPQLVVLGVQLALLVQHRPQHLLQRGGVVWQGFWVDLHGQMMDGAAASQPAFSARKFRAAHRYWSPPLTPVEQGRQLRRCQRYPACRRRRWPNELALFQPLGQHA